VAVDEQLTTQVAAPPRPRVDNRLLEGFRRWLESRVSDDTTEYYVGAVEPPEPPRLNETVTPGLEPFDTISVTLPNGAGQRNRVRHQRDCEDRQHGHSGVRLRVEARERTRRIQCSPPAEYNASIEGPNNMATLEYGDTTHENTLPATPGTANTGGHNAKDNNIAIRHNNTSTG